MGEGRASGTITVLFTDLVGSTELMAGLGAEAFDTLRQVHFKALRAAIGRHGGEEVKNTGDGLMATFGSVVDALRCAISMQQATDRQGHPTTTAIAIRVGVSIGEVTFEDGDVFGTPVVEAARLVAAAGPGKILTTAIARALAGGRAELEFVDLGPLPLKGLPDAVPACEIAWQPSGPSIPMPALLTDIGRIFVGRQTELEWLQHLWKQVASGQRRAALVAGEPGVGKTRLAAEVAGWVHGEGGLVLTGRCDEGLGVPYQPFVEAFRHFVDHTPDEQLAGRLGRYGGELLRLVPELAVRVPDLAPPVVSDPETERYRLFDGIAAWLATISAEEPVLLVVDDLQWAAKPTLLLLRHIVGSPDESRLLVLGTYRDSELDPDHPLVEVLADLRRHDGVQRLSLMGLEPSGVAAYLEESAGHALDDDDLALARVIHDETEGNPFFVREVLRHLIESGAVERRGDGWATRLPLRELGIPEGVREVVGRRLARLSEETNVVLRLAAVVGAEFDPRWLVTGTLREDGLISALEEATAARLVVEVSQERYRFTHALVRDTVYDGLSAVRRAALHRHVGQAIETRHAGGLDDYCPALAQHFARAGDADKESDYAIRAGDQAMAQLAFEAAAVYYQQALDASSRMSGQGTVRRGALLVALGRARARGGDARAGDTYLAAAELARSCGDAEGLAGAALGLADLWGSTGAVDDTRISLLDEAREALDGATSSVTAQLLARLATELYFVPGSWDRREKLSTESVEVARRLGDPRTLAFSLHARNYALWSPGGAEERLADGREIVVLAEQGGDRELTLHGYAWCQIALLELGDVAGLDVELANYHRLADELRQPRYRWYAATRLAMRALLGGDLDRGERMVRVARDIGSDAGEPDAETGFAAQMFVVWQERPSQEGLDVMDAQCRAAETSLHPESPLVLGLRAMRLLLLLDSAKSDEAGRELDEFVPVALTKLDPSYYGMGWALLAGLLTAASVRLSDTNSAATLYDLLLPYSALHAQNCGAVTFDGSYAHHLGMLAATLTRWDEAEEHLVVAAAAHERMGAAAYLARTRLELANMLLTRRQPGDAMRARVLLGQALDAARELGLGNVERRAVTLLQDVP